MSSFKFSWSKLDVDAKSGQHVSKKFAITQSALTASISLICEVVLPLLIIGFAGALMEKLSIYNVLISPDFLIAMIFLAITTASKYKATVSSKLSEEARVLTVQTIHFISLIFMTLYILSKTKEKLPEGAEYVIMPLAFLLLLFALFIRYRVILIDFFEVVEDANEKCCEVKNTIFKVK
ncbi:MAG: hypothetical protein ABL920_04650 [Methylotenera sp.]